jgi:mannose-6-phosphate isomerase
MKTTALYPLRFEPIFQKRIWGGRRLGEWLGPLPGDGPIGEAWVLSDQGQHLSRVANGPLRGQTLRQLMEKMPAGLLGAAASGLGVFPVLLKFLDARDVLSVQVHPDDRHTHLLPPGQRGKTEAWVVLEAEPGSRIYAGLRPGIGPQELRQALRGQTVADCLESFAPRPGDCFFLPAGTVHALGGGLLIFEIQQNSDVTFRLHDWGRVDAQTGQPRPLHIEESLACTDFTAAVSGPVQVSREQEGWGQRERLIACPHFQLTRWHADQPFRAGAANECRILVGIAGQLDVEYAEQWYPLRRGEVVLLPAEVGACLCRPVGQAVILECSLS